MNKQNLLLTGVLLSLSSSAFAGSWSCRHNDNVREIHIEQSTSAPVPCSVVYRKLTEGAQDRVLWSAENDAGYCEAKAQAFVEKQTSWGWTCVETLSDKNPADETIPDSTIPDSPTADEPAAESASTEPAIAPPATETPVADTLAAPSKENTATTSAAGAN